MSDRPSLRFPDGLFDPGVRQLFDDLVRHLDAPARFTLEQPFPRLNVWEHPDRYEVEIDVPGVEPDALDLSVEDNVLRIRGVRQLARGSEHAVHVRERRDGDFERTLELPARIDPREVQAAFRNGVVTVTLPKDETQRRRQVPVSVPR